jgi:hypothetical protein
MRRFPLTLILLTAFTISGLCFPNADEEQQRIIERESIKALSRLNVPVHLDVNGSARWLVAARGEMNDEALSWLPGLYNLEWLEIGGGAATASGLKHLKKCVSLKRLYIHDIDLGGNALPWLSSLKKLEALSLYRTGSDGSVLDNIKATDSLMVLNLTKSRIVDADMNRIARFKRLEVLALAATKITVVGLEKLKGMNRLNVLNLIDCNIYDADLIVFLNMPNLRILFARGCHLSDAAIKNFKLKFLLLAIFR